MDNRYGLFFPIQLKDGSPLPPDIEASVDASINHILVWLFGTRNFNTHFGSLVPAILGAPLSSTTKASLITYTVTALEKWEQRLDIDSVDITSDLDNGVLILNISGTVEDLERNYTYNIRL